MSLTWQASPCLNLFKYIKFEAWILEMRMFHIHTRYVTIIPHKQMIKWYLDYGSEKAQLQYRLFMLVQTDAFYWKIASVFLYQSDLHAVSDRLPALLQ